MEPFSRPCVEFRGDPIAVALRQEFHALAPGQVLAKEPEGSPLSCEPGEIYKHSASFRMASDSAATYGQVR